MAQPPPANPQGNQPTPAHALAPQAAAVAQPPPAGAVAPSAPAAVAQQPLAVAAVSPAQVVAQQPQVAQQVAHAQPAHSQPQRIRFRLSHAPPAETPFGIPPHDIQITFSRARGPYVFTPDGMQFATYFPILAYSNRVVPGTLPGAAYGPVWPVRTLGGRRAPPALYLFGGFPESLIYLSAQALANSLFLPDGRILTCEVPHMLFHHQNVFRILYRR